MSQENVENVRRVYELFRRGDYRAALAYFDPDVQTIEPHGMPGGATYFGHAGLAEAFFHFTDAWASYTVEIEQLTEAGDRVVAVARYHATGRESGVVVETTVAHVYAFEDGRIARWEMFNTRDEALEALEAAGLRE
jgi:ketosteroid isomerase-like protein